MAIGDKECSACGALKPADHFSAAQVRCNKCRASKMKSDANASVASYMTKKLSGVRYRHRKKNNGTEPVKLDHLMALYQQQGGMCALTGLPMHSTSDESDLSVSVDRINNDLGYEDGNIRLVCARVNLMMNTLDDAHFTWWCRAVVNHIGN